MEQNVKVSSGGRVGALIVSSLSNELRKSRYQDNPNALAGHCYVASEAYFHLMGGKEAGLGAMNVRHEGDSHWFIKDRNEGGIIDLTAEQFETPVPYDEAVGRGFLTKEPSARAREVIQRVRNELSQVEKREREL